MKSIFTKLSTLILCGVIALVGCTDYSADIQDLNNKLNSEVSTLKTTIQDLRNEIEDTYATIAEVEALRGTVTTLQTKLDTKADKTALEAAIDDYTNKINGLDEKYGEYVAEINGYVNAFKAALKVENAEQMQAAVEQLVKQLGDVVKDLDDYKTETNKTLGDILERLGKVESDIVTINGSISDINSALAKKADAADVDAKVEALYKAIEEAEKFDENTTVKQAITKLNGQYSSLAQELAKLDEAIKALRNELRSIVVVPEVMVNGVKTIEFNTFSYSPLNVDGERVEKVDSEKAVYYMFNPSSFALANADYSIVSENVKLMTKTAGEAPVSIKNVEAVAGEKGKVKVTLALATGSDNMFALAATMKDNDNIVIYSDYVQLLVNNVNAEDLVLTNNEDVALAELAEVAVKEGESLDLAEYVKVRNNDIASFGLEYRFSVVEGDLQLEGSVAKGTQAGKGASVVKVEVIDPANNNNVVLSEDLNVKVLTQVTYVRATATASVEASRMSYDITSIPDWVTNLYNQGNTKELLAQAIEAIKNGKIDEAFKVLGGVPGFITITDTFTGVGVAELPIAANMEDLADSLIPDIDDIDSVDSLIEFLEKLAAKYEESAYVELFKGLNLSSYIPVSSITATLEKIPLLGTALSNSFKNTIASLEDFSLIDLIKNDNVKGLLEAVDTFSDYLGGMDLIDFDLIRTKLIEIVGNLEGSVGDSLVGSAEQTTIALAKAAAESAARENVVANFNAANKAIKQEFEDGVFGLAMRVVNSDVATETFEKLGITSVQEAFNSLFETAVLVAQYDILDLLKTKIDSSEAEKLAPVWE
jgi:predicted  nucleic acid-binding Zn-ribbon protein